MKKKIKILTAAVLAYMMIMPCSIYAAENENIEPSSIQSQAEDEESGIELFATTTGPYWSYTDTSGKNELTITGNSSESLSPSCIGTFGHYTATKKVIIKGFTATSGAVFSKDWSKVTSLTLPAELTKISNSAFSGMTNLKETVEIPAKVTSIGDNAFATQSLNSYRFLGKTPPTLGTDALTGSDDFVIYVPNGCGAAYKAASGWEPYTDRIKEEGDANVVIQGDVSSDGSADKKDAAMMFKKILLNNYKFPIEGSGKDYMEYADMNGDNKLNLLDAVLVLKNMN